jgi:putative ATP-binding cassette transporter
MNLLTLFQRRSKSGLCIAIAGGVASGLSTTALIVIVNRMIHRHGAYSTAIICAFAALCLIRLLSGILSHTLLVRLSQNAVHALRLDLCRRIINAPLRQLEQIGAGPLSTVFTEDMLAVATSVITLPYLFVNMIVLCGCLVYLGWLSCELLVGIGGSMTLGALSYRLATRRANALLRAARQEQQELFEQFHNLIAGAKELKLHAARRSEFVANLTGCADRVRMNNTAGITLYSAAANWGRLLFFVYVGLLLLWAGHAWSPEELATRVIIILYMMAPLEGILNALPGAVQAYVALEKVYALNSLLGSEACAALVDATSSNRLAKRQNHWRELAMEGITFAYQRGPQSRPFTMGPIDLVLAPGQITFLVGGNGSGKTTLGKLIVGLYRPEAGEVRLDGECLSNRGHEECRAMFSAVFNDFCLFEQLLGIEPSQMKMASAYLHYLKLDRKVFIQNGRFSTTALSQGQRKRLALLVALLEDRPIYLFDEWASDQDPEFKEFFYGHIVPDLSRSGKAVIVITHDDRYFHIADRLVRLDQGKAADTRPRHLILIDSAFAKVVQPIQRLDVEVM